MSVRSRGPWLPLFVILAALMLGLLLAALLAVQAMLPLAALAGVGLIAIVASLKRESLVWGLLVSSLVLGGGVAYFVGIGQAQWLPLGIAAGLYVSVVLYLAGQAGQATRSVPVPQPLGMVLLLLALVVAVVSTAWEGVGVLHWVYGLRYYMGMAVLCVALAVMPWRPETLRQFWMACVAVAILQFPVALYQYVAVAGQRIAVGADGVAWDAIVGTMGGKQEGGGQSAALGFFCVSIFVLTFALWKRQLWPMWKAALFTLTVLGVIFLAEVKAMVVIMPLAVLLILRADVLTHIRQVMAGLLVVVLLAVSMPWLYSKLHYERSGGAAVSFDEFYAKILENSDSEHINEGTQQLGRVAQVVFWWKEHTLASDPKHFLLGHGMGTTNSARVYVGDVVKKYFPLSVTNTAGGMLLWETGVLGTGLVIAALLSTALLSMRLSRRQEVPEFHRAALEAGAVILLILIPSLFYKHFALKSPATQFVIFFAAGQAYYWHATLARQLRSAEAKSRLAGRYVARRLA